jgi:F-type H+-transporting ATPase subunit delta
MNLSRIPVRYAKAIFMLAKEQNLLLQVYEDFNLIKNTIAPIENFKNIITSPIIKPKDKIEFFNKIFTGKINDITLNFLKFIVEKDREAFLPEITIYFKELYRKEYNIKEIVVTTTNPISSESKEKISNLVEGHLKCNTEIQNITTDKIIGGVVIRVDNNQLDLSVTTQLKKIKKSLKSEVYKIGL